MAEIVVDDSEWPVVRVVWPSSVDGPETERYLSRIRALMDRHEPHGYVHLLPDSGPPSAQVRKMIADYKNQNAAEARVYLKAYAFVVPSAMARGVLTAISWFAKSSYPEKNFDTEAPARAWVDAKLR